MDDFLGNKIQNLAETKLANDSCCPDLDLKTRMIGFCISIILSVFLYSMSLATIIGAVTGSSTFIIIYTCANISFIAS
jgi:heme/copper-type cytochrome/quinol oxidase subunit 4